MKQNKNSNSSDSRGKRDWMLGCTKASTWDRQLGLEVGKVVFQRAFLIVLYQQSDGGKRQLAANAKAFLRHG